jgi:hypothetical protein
VLKQKSIRRRRLRLIDYGNLESYALRSDLKYTGYLSRYLERNRGLHNKSLELSPKVRFQFVLESIAVVLTGLMRRRNSTLCYLAELRKPR